MKQLINKIITLAVFINKRKENLHILLQVIKLLNVLIFLLQMLEPSIMSYTKTTSLSPDFLILYSAISGQYTDGTIITEISYVTAIMLIGLALTLGYYARCGDQIMGKLKKNYLDLLVLWYPVFVLVLIELLYPSKIFYLIECYRSDVLH